MIWLMTIVAFLGTVVAAMLVFFFFPERADSHSTEKARTAATGAPKELTLIECDGIGSGVKELASDTGAEE
jgi:hypothetical protein